MNKKRTYLAAKFFGLLSRRQWQILTMISAAITLMLVTTGCSASWISEAQQIITTLTTIIGSITSIVGLFGAAVSPTATSIINEAVTDANNELAVVGPLITQYESTPSTGTLSSITNALNAVKAKLASLVGGIVGISAALQAKIGDIVTLGINTVEEILALIPSPTATMAELHAHYGKIKDFFDKKPVKKLKDDYNAIIRTPSGDAAVDAVLAKVQTL